MISNSHIYYNNGFGKKWVSGSYNIHIINTIDGCLKTFLDTKNYIILDTTCVREMENNRREQLLQNAKKVKYIFVIGFLDPNSFSQFYNFFHFFKKKILKKKIIEIGYTSSSNNNGIFFDFWSVNCYHHFKRYTISELELNNNFKNLFLCYQYKPHKHRQLFLLFLKLYKLHTDGIITLGSDLKPYIYKGIKSITYTDTTAYDYKTGYKDSYAVNKGTQDMYTLGRLDFWQESLFNIVSETKFISYGVTASYAKIFWSEKSLKPLIGMRPFFIYGTPYINNKLKSLGFDIFEDLWCEQDLYTSCTCEEHAKKIIKILNYYKKYDKNKLYELYQQLYPRLLHNRNHFFKHAEQQQNIINNIDSAVKEIILQNIS